MRTDPSTLPNACGVYLFRSSSGRVLYVGKAVNIRSRIRSHLQDRRNPKEKKLRDSSETIDFIATKNELEALVLEDTLIKRYRPKFNVRMKDDKSYPFLLVTDELYPAVRQVRGIRSKEGVHYGPHEDPRAVRRSLRWLRKVFPVRSCRRDLKHPSRPCLEYHMGRCMAPCKGDVALDNYIIAVDGLKRFLSGKREEVLSGMEKEMWKASSEGQYERAALIRDMIEGSKRIREGQKVVLVKGGDIDIIGFSDSSDAASLVQVREGRVTDVVSLSLESEEPLSGPEEGFVTSYYNMVGSIPPVIVISPILMRTDHLKELSLFLSAKGQGPVRVRGPRGEDERALVEMALKNLDHFLRKREMEVESSWTGPLREALKMEQSPEVIEGFDISHLSGTGTVASMVTFRNGRPFKEGYRRFKVRTAGNDDIASMTEVVTRRYRRLLDENKDLPDLILIDGGRGQLNAAAEALRSAGVSDPPRLVSLAKKDELLYVPESMVPISLKRTDPALKLLQRIRDEAHRFAVAYQRKLRRPETSILREVKGVGDSRVRCILTEFASLEEVMEQGVDGLRTRCGIPRNVGEAIIEHIRTEMKDKKDTNHAREAVVNEKI